MPETKLTPDDETKLTPDDVVQLRRVHAGERHTAMPEDVERWRSAGWLEPEPSWSLTRLGLAAICWDPGGSKPTDDDLVQLRQIHEGRRTVLTSDLARWRLAGWLEAGAGWKLTPAGLELIGEWTKIEACAALLIAMRRWDDKIPSDDRLDQYLMNHGLPPVSASPPACAGHEVANVLPDPGPDLRPPPAVRPRTPEEVRPAREALRRLSDALLRHEAPALRAAGRLAFIHSILPLAAPAEVGDALAFTGRVLAQVCEPGVWRGVTIPEETVVRQAVLGALGDLGHLVDDLRAEVAGERVTDRRRSVTDEGLSQRERGWGAVPVELLDLLLDRARAAAKPGGLLTGELLGGIHEAVLRVDAARAAASSRL